MKARYRRARNKALLVAVPVVGLLLLRSSTVALLLLAAGILVAVVRWRWAKRGRRQRRRLTATQRRRVRMKTLGRCYYCRRRLARRYSSGNPRSMEIDHKVPFSKGGSCGFFNLVPACRGCNQAKGSMSVARFRRRNWWRWRFLINS